MSQQNSDEDSIQPRRQQLIPGVPDNFPRGGDVVSLSGAMPKVALVELDGRFYPEGGTPEDIVTQFEMCEDLAEQGRAYCRRKMAEGVVANEGAALERLHTGLQGKDWCTAEQKTWIVQRVAELQGWVVPASVPALLSGK